MIQSTFAAWLRILARVENSILWLLRFPPAGEEHLLRTARQWAGTEVASRIRFTDVVTKDEHIDRVGAADIFLDTVEVSTNDCISLLAVLMQFAVQCTYSGC